MISAPFGWLMSFFYGVTDNYAFALLLFTIVVQIVLLPLGIKQQRNSIRMAQIRPKEQVIRKKYAGRKDQATQQKMLLEIQAMYRSENYSPMASGCMPLLIQMPIIFALFNIVRRPLTYIAGFGPELIDRIEEFLDIPSVADVQIQIVRAFEGTSQYFEGNLYTIRSAIGPYLTGISEYQIDLFHAYENMNFGFLGQSLLSAPSEAFLSALMLIPILNFAVSFLQMKVTRKIQGKGALGEAMNNPSMKIMEYTMPLMIVWFSYTMNSALGLYWVYRSVVAIAQTFVLARIYPIPEVTEEALKLAEQQYGDAKKKKKKKKPAGISGEAEDTDETDEYEEEEDDGGKQEGIPEKSDVSKEREKKKGERRNAPKKFTVKRRSGAKSNPE